MPNALKFTVPLTPPDVNHYVRHTRKGGHYVTREATAFKQAVAVYAKGGFVQAKHFYIAIRVTLAKKQKGDVDGFPKLVLDGLADCGAFRDKNGKRVSDAYVRGLYIFVDSTARPAEGYTEIVVEPQL